MFAKLIAVRSLAIGAFVVLAGSGIAIAATASTTPHVPTPHNTHAAVPSDHPSDTDATESEAPETEASQTEASESDASESAASSTPSPSLEGLCHAFQAGATDNPGKAIDNPAFSVLVAAAGGADNLTSFCDGLIGPRATHAQGKPAGVPPSHPGPSEHPKGAVTPSIPSHPEPSHATPSHPTGRP